MDEECLHFDCVNISEEWFKLGNDRKPNDVQDVLFKFVAYWIAFNSLFEKAWHNSADVNEYKKIEHYINKEYEEKLKGVIDFDNSPELAVFKERPVSNDKPNKKNKENTTEKNKENYDDFMNSALEEKKRLIALINMIKQVRNNLFHGSKAPHPERNYDLVNSSQKVLEKILDALIEKRRY